MVNLAAVGTLTPLDRATETLCQKNWIRYQWFMDDYMIFAKTRNKLKAAIKRMYAVLEPFSVEWGCGAVALGLVCLWPPLSSGGARVGSKINITAVWHTRSRRQEIPNGLNFPLGFGIKTLLTASGR